MRAMTWYCRRSPLFRQVDVDVELTPRDHFLNGVAGGLAAVLHLAARAGFSAKAAVRGAPIAALLARPS
jgi:hypothetical protein